MEIRVCKYQCALQQLQFQLDDLGNICDSGECHSKSRIIKAERLSYRNEIVGEESQDLCLVGKKDTVCANLKMKFLFRALYSSFMSL